MHERWMQVSGESKFGRHEEGSMVARTNEELDAPLGVEPSLEEETARRKAKLAARLGVDPSMLEWPRLMRQSVSFRYRHRLNKGKLRRAYRGAHGNPWVYLIHRAARRGARLRPHRILVIRQSPMEHLSQRDRTLLSRAIRGISRSTSFRLR